MFRHACLFIPVVCLLGCPGPGPALPDGSSDAGADAGQNDAGIDAGIDAGRDAGADAGVDAGLDGGSDAGLDGGFDGGFDAGGDAGFDAGSDAGFDAGFDAGPPVDLCDAGAKRCLAHDQRRSCGATSGGLRWIDQTCAPGSGCVLGDCVVGACSDECTFGDTDGGWTCELYDLPSASWVGLDAGGSMHDRSRDFTRWLRRDGMATGGVGSARYSDAPVYSQIDAMNGIGDSALWTGTYLAAEALRLQATGAADARANVIDLVGKLHVWLSVSGSPGNLARWARRSNLSSPFAIGDLVCGDQRVHCNTMWQGNAYDYIGHVSRDQYQGVVLGYALAFDALGPEDAATKDVLRADMVTLVTELMRERTVPMRLTINGVPMPVSNVNARFIVINPAEMINGTTIDLTVSLSGGSNEMWGFQEFYPDLAELVRQVPGLGLTPALPRPSSAIMLASFFRVALRMTENDPRFATEHANILTYYTSHSGQGGNITNWLAIAHQWTAGTGCNQSYYSNNITFEPLYNLARLEDDPARRADIQNTLFTSQLWPTFAPTKNPFFSYIYAGTVSGVSAAVTASALTQLAQFPPPPRVQWPVDLRSDPRYPHDPSCPDQVDHSMAVDVRDRAVGDFMWQRDPWQLFDWGDVRQTEPGVDYLVAYWMGRKHGFIADDSVGRCLVRH